MERQPLVIVGAGPAGLSAAVYTARAGIDTLVIGCSPKVAGDYDIDNYFGFDETISGKELMDRGIRQAQRFGARISCEKVLGVHHGENGNFHVKTDQLDYDADAVLLATGVGRVRPGISNLADYEGKGVSYCVSCDGFFYKGRNVTVVGEGIYAANQALELTNYTPHVQVFSQGKQLTMTDQYRKLLENANIPVIEDKVVELAGSPALQSMQLESGKSVETEGLFVAMGEASSLDFAFTLGLERTGVFIKANSEQQTNIPGIFAAGDCTGGFLQIAVAVGEGATAARSAISHVKKVIRL